MNKRTNKIYFDAEFCDITQKEIRFLSVALIKESGEEFYVEIAQPKHECSDWVIDNVLPLLGNKDTCPTCKGVGKVLEFFQMDGGGGERRRECFRCHGSGRSPATTEDQAREKISAFLGNEKYQLIADVNQFDWIGWCRLMGEVFQQPLDYIPLDLATKLAVKGFDPDCDRQELAREMGLPCNASKKHNALEDARLCKALWEAL